MIFQLFVTMVGDRGNLGTTPRAVQRKGAFITAKRVNARQNESRNYSGPRVCAKLTLTELREIG